MGEYRKIKIPGSVPSKRAVDKVPGFDWRYGGKKYAQNLVVARILDEMERADNIVLEASTGQGKSLIGQAVAHNIGGRSYTLTPLTALQEQYVKDFPYLSNVWGRNRYECGVQYVPSISNYDRFYGATAKTGPCTFDSDFIGMKNTLSGPVYNCKVRNNGGCEYFSAWEAAKMSANALSNPAFLFLHHRLGNVEKRDLLIADEAHGLYETMVGLMAVEVTPRDWTDFGMKTPWPCPADTDPKSLKLFQWYDQDSNSGPLAELEEVLLNEIDRLSVRGNKNQRIQKRLQRASELLRDIGTVISNASRGWAVDKNRNGNSVKFIPVDVRVECQDFIEKISEKRLFMSATIGDAKLLIHQLGLDIDSTCFVQITQSPFPVERRRIHIDTTLGNMRRANPNQEAAKKNIFNHVCDLIEQKTIGEGKNGAIFPFSHYLMREMVKAWDDRSGETNHSVQDGGGPTLIWDSSYKLALQRFMDTSEPRVLVTTAMEGLDLRGDHCRWIAMPKSPNPDSSSNWVQARMEGEDKWRWYRNQVALLTQQACGRGNRSVDDFCEIYLLDAHLWAGPVGIKRNHWLYNQWFLDAIVKDGDPDPFNSSNSNYSGGKGGQMSRGLTIKNIREKKRIFL